MTWQRGTECGASGVRRSESRRDATGTKRSRCDLLSTRGVLEIRNLCCIDLFSRQVKVRRESRRGTAAARRFGPEVRRPRACGCFSYPRHLDSRGEQIHAPKPAEANLGITQQTHTPKPAARLETGAKAPGRVKRQAGDAEAGGKQRRG